MICNLKNSFDFKNTIALIISVEICLIKDNIYILKLLFNILLYPSNQLGIKRVDILYYFILKRLFFRVVTRY
jgi:hypothetical protein